jgi:hypothetical protein
MQLLTRKFYVVCMYYAEQQRSFNFFVSLFSEIYITSVIHSFCSLSYDRSVASSKASSPQGAI